MPAQNVNRVQQLREENQALRARLEEAEQIIHALHHDEVDALVVSGPMGDQVYTIETADRPYRLLVENATDFAIVTLDPQGCLDSWNKGAERMFGYSEAEIRGQPGALLFTPEDRERGLPEEEMRIALDSGRTEDDRWLIRKDGSRFYASGVMTPFYNGHGRFLGYARIMRDLTERKRLEEERAALVQETSILSERNRMAQELHDTLAQAFTAIKLQLDAGEEALDTEPSQARANLVRAREIAQESLHEVRRAVRALRSGTLDLGGLVQACEHLVEQATEGTGIEIEWRIEGSLYSLPPLVESELFRIAQEALTNALRHAQAPQIALTFTYAPHEVFLQVVDRGVGFDVLSCSEGFGLMGMRERARRIGGNLTICSEPGKGTEILVSLPKTALPDKAFH